MRISQEEKERIKKEYKRLKAVYNELKKSLKKIPSESQEHYEMMGEISNIGYEMAKLRNTLLNSSFIVERLDNFIFGDEELRGR